MEYEYGWNDPPTFSYSSSQTAAGKQSSLNKRPSHPPGPLPPHKTPTGPPATSQEPPTDVPCPPTGATGNFSAGKWNKEKGDEKLDSRLCAYEEAEFADVVERFSQLTDGLQDQLQKRVYEDIKRRVGILRQQAKEGKISAAVKLKTGRLLAAMETQQYDQADSIQVGLMVDHVSEVNQWLVGIKKLIAVLKSNQL